MDTAQRVTISTLMLVYTRAIAQARCNEPLGCLSNAYCDEKTSLCLPRCGRNLELLCEIDEICDDTTLKCTNMCFDLCRGDQYCDTNTARCEECSSLCQPPDASDYPDCSLYCPDYRRGSRRLLTRADHPGVTRLQGRVNWSGSSIIVILSISAVFSVIVSIMGFRWIRREIQVKTSQGQCKDGC